MIQAIQTSNVEAAAPQGEKKVLDEELEKALESLEFESELMASLTNDKNQVQPVQVPVEQMLQKPSSLLNLKPHNPETTNPKIFDPGLTKGVENLVKPQASLTPEQMLKLENIENPKLKAELMKSMMDSNQKALSSKEVDPKALDLKVFNPMPQVSGRSPAIDFAKSEIDPQLMNLEDFISQKNLVTKKNIQPQAYGMQKSSLQKMAMENSLKSTQVVTDTSAVEKIESAPTNSQQFILNLMNKDQVSSSKLQETQAPNKIFDMSHIKSSDSNQIMNQISDYMVQAKAGKEPTVSMRVNHDELGMIDITVQKTPMTQDSVAINIGAHTTEGKNFFQSNSKDLFSQLSNSGINVSDFKVDTPSQSAKNDFDMTGQSNRHSAGQEKQFGSEQNQRRHDADRRQELWKQFRDKDAA